MTKICNMDNYNLLKFSVIKAFQFFNYDLQLGRPILGFEWYFEVFWNFPFGIQTVNPQIIFWPIAYSLSYSNLIKFMPFAFKA